MFVIWLYIKQKYLAGWRLPRPPKCPLELYRIMSECWAKLSDCRKQPQAIVRDIHQILYQCKYIVYDGFVFPLFRAYLIKRIVYSIVIGTKRAHSYASITPESSINGAFDITSVFNWTSCDADNPNAANFSDGTLSTFIHDISQHSGSNQSNSTNSTWLFQGMV